MPFYVTACGVAVPLPTGLPLLPGLCQLPIPFGVNLLLAASEHVLRRDVANGTVQTEVGLLRAE